MFGAVALAWHAAILLRARDLEGHFMLVQVITIEIKPGSRETLLESFRDNCAGSRAEPGNVRLDVLSDQEDSHRFTIYEAFVDAEALEAHRRTAHYRICR
jgi:(4S)-4-hydroxy-5-phosphonooxypentane-2,3-dione isomerase